MAEKKNCAVYARVSTVRQSVVIEGGLDTQIAKLKARVKFENEQSGVPWEIVGVYREEGVSGKDLDRPAYQRLVRDIEEGRINTVLIVKLDRITRSLQDFFTLTQFFEEHDIELISLNDKIETKSAFGRAMLKINLVYSELERDLASERTAMTMQHRATKGLNNGGHIFGYDRDPSNKGKLIPNPDHAPLVQEQFFEKYLEVGSIGALCRHLQTVGLTRPRYTSRRGLQQGGKPFTKENIKSILSNPVYIGKIRYKDDLFEGQHEGIVDPDLFERVQKKLEETARKRRNFREVPSRVFILNGVLKCSKCGSQMTSKHIVKKGQKYYYYECTKHAKLGKQGCDQPYVPADAIETVILDDLKKLTISPQTIDEMVRDANGSRDTQASQIDSELRLLKGHLRKLEGEEANLLEAVAEGGKTAYDLLKGKLESHRQEIVRLTGEIEKKEFLKDKVEKDLYSAEAMAGAFSSLAAIFTQAKPQDLKEVVPILIDEIKWSWGGRNGKRGHCEITYFENPLLDWRGVKARASEDEEAGYAEWKEWLPHVDSNHEHTD